MQFLGTLFFLFCFFFIAIIFGVVVFAVYLKNKMTVFKDVQMEDEAYHNEPYVDADFYSIGHENPMPESFNVTADDIIDTTYRVIQSDEDDAEASDSDKS